MPPGPAQAPKSPQAVLGLSSLAAPCGCAAADTNTGKTWQTSLCIAYSPTTANYEEYLPYHDLLSFWTSASPRWYRSESAVSVPSICLRPNTSLCVPSAWHWMGCWEPRAPAHIAVRCKTKGHAVAQSRAKLLRNKDGSSRGLQFRQTCNVSSCGSSQPRTSRRSSIRICSCTCVVLPSYGTVLQRETERERERERESERERERTNRRHKEKGEPSGIGAAAGFLGTSGPRPLWHV